MKKPFKTKRVICIKCKRRLAVPVETETPYICHKCREFLEKNEAK